MTLYSQHAAPRRPLRRTWATLALVALSGASCKDKSEQEPAPEPAPQNEPTEEKKPAEEQAAREIDRQVAALRREANVLFAQSAFDEAKVKVEAALALDPQHSPLLRLRRRIDSVLSNRCCGKWLRFDTTKPGAEKKELRGVLYSENVGKNHRDDPFRARTMVACDQGKMSMKVLVPWNVPERSPVSVVYALGEEKGTENVTTDVKDLGYTFPDPDEWLKRLGEHEDEELKLELPKSDGTTGQFVFSLDKSKQVTDEILAACQ